MSDIPFALPDIGRYEIEGVVECLESGWLTAGAKVKDFEQQFAERVGARFAISCNSATTAALLLMDALGVRPGDEVVVPVWTFSGPAMMAHKLGAKVVFCDVDPITFNMTVSQLHRVVTKKTKLVMPTHFAGRSCNMGDLLDFCMPKGLHLVDDAAHAFPAFDYYDQPIGSQGALATFFSFYATKTLTTGEGGMIVTEDNGLAIKLKALRCHGISRDVYDRYTNAETDWHYDVEEAGWKANLTDIAAAIGIGQLRRSMTMLWSRKVIAHRYDAAFVGLEAHGLVSRPMLEDGHAWHLYPLRVTVNRDRFIRLMRREGVQCSMHFIPLNKHSFWRKHAKNGTAPFPNADMLYEQEVSLPIYSRMTRQEVDRVICAVRKVLGEC